ncbi:MAG: cupin domain-containing protein [Clostridiales bacterium]|nr:cupin domain-containing protein [Clostridiales bacterium]
MEAKVVLHHEVPFTELGGGVKRRVLAYNAQQMIVEVVFEKGGVGAPHTHPHVQSTYVKSGAFRFTIDGKDVDVTAGDTIAFPPDILHGTVCLEAGTLLDIFTPMREDFIG